MGAFRFEAARDDGSIERGEMDADGVRHVRARLRERGLVALTVQPATGAPGRSGRFFAHSFSSAALALATRQLASLVSAGLPLDAALSTLVEQCDDERQRELWRGVRAEVLAGRTLADAMETFPGSFSRLYCATVRAGEQAGRFGLVLERLAGYLEDREALRGKVFAAALYPAIVTVIAIAIVLFLMTYVVPQVVQVFENNHQHLPLPTRALLIFSDALRLFGLPMLVLAAAAVALWRAALRNAAVRKAQDIWLLQLPVVGKLLRGMDTARYAATLSMLTDAGVPMLRALAAAEATMASSVMREAARDTMDSVSEGQSLARALARSKMFPPVLVRLVEVGETTGRLPDMLGHAARNLSAEVERRTSGAAALLEPILILLMGAFVLAIVVAVMLPIIEVNQLVR